MTTKMVITALLLTGLGAVAGLAGADKASAPKPTVKGKCVRIETTSEYLALAEVEVFSGGKNVALKKAATQSSTNYAEEIAGAFKAVDGNTRLDWSYDSDNTTSHTKNGEKEWWEVDLKDVATIESITVWHATPCDARLVNGGAVIKVLDEKRKVVWEAKFIDDSEVYKFYLTK